jgi:hypothetical protein
MKISRQKKSAGGSEPEAEHPTSGSGLTPGVEAHSHQITHKTTGPRTSAGKERSKHNAFKHGIFSTVIVLNNESQQEYDSLLLGLQDDLNPQGMLEHILVEKLATLTWRLRRLLIAERAEIQNGADFLECDKKELVIEEAREFSLSNSDDFGLVAEIANPFVLKHCLRLLDDLGDEIDRGGFGPESDEEALSKIYGNSCDVFKTLFDSYRKWSFRADCTDKERKKEGYPSKDQCVSKFLEALEKEKRRLIRYKEEHARIESERTRLQSLLNNVPDAPDVDRLIRYGSYLERSFEKTLTQLERLQRMRLGQPVLPPIKVDVSSS